MEKKTKGLGNKKNVNRCQTKIVTQSEWKYENTFAGLKKKYLEYIY